MPGPLVAGASSERNKELFLPQKVKKIPEKLYEDKTYKW